MDAGRYRPCSLRGRFRVAALRKCRAARWSMRRAPNGWSPGLRSARSASARWPMPRCRFSRWCSRPPLCIRWQAACSARPLRRSASGLSGTAAISERLGRNARFASIGNGLAAAVMAGVGYFSPRGGFHRHRLFADTGGVGVAQHRRGRDRSGARPRRGIAARSEAADQTRRIDAQPAAFDICRLLASLSLGQRGHVAAGGQRRHHALSALGDNLDRRLYCRSPARRRGPLAVDRPARADLGPPAVAADRFCRLAGPGLAVRMVTDPEVLVVIQILDGITAAVFA